MCAGETQEESSKYTKAIESFADQGRNQRESELSFTKTICSACTVQPGEHRGARGAGGGAPPWLPARASQGVEGSLGAGEVEGEPWKNIKATPAHFPGVPDKQPSPPEGL